MYNNSENTPEGFFCMCLKTIYPKQTHKSYFNLKCRETKG